MQLSELAAQAFQSFMRVYWDSERRYFYRYSDHTRHESAPDQKMALTPTTGGRPRSGKW